jgi:hypothetical protein
VHRTCPVDPNQDFVNSVWVVNVDNVEEQYKNFLLKKANEIGATVNPYWFDLLNREEFHSHLTPEEYENLKKDWEKVLKTWHIEKFIENILGGSRQKFKEIWK